MGKSTAVIKTEAKIELVPPHLFEGEEREECLADLYRSVDRLLMLPEGRLASLPIVDWTFCEGVPGYVTIRLFAKRIPGGDIAAFLFEMVNRGLLGGRHVEIFTSQHVAFTLPQYEGGELLYAAIAIHVDRQAELAQLADTFPSLSPDLELGALAPEFATLLQQSLLPEKGADLPRVRYDSFRWLMRWTVGAGVDLFQQFTPFAAALTRPFREIRSKGQLASIFKRLFLLRRSVLKEWNIKPRHRALRLSIFSSKLQYPFGEKQVTSICIAVNCEKEWEVLDESAAVAALESLSFDIHMVQGSFFSYQPLEEGIRFLYFEVECRSFTEKGRIRKQLPEELKARIGTLSHSLFLPKNEEEILRSILVLSNEVRSTTSSPQVVVAFQGIAEKELTFTVILVRLLKKGALLASDIIERLAKGWKGHLEQDRILGKVRHLEKGASVFTISLPNNEFLRRDRSVDLGAARIALTTHLKGMLPKLNDYHGGFLLKQEQILTEVKKLLGNTLSQYEHLLEELFYSLSPAIMQSYLQPRLVAYLFNQVMEHARVPLDSRKEYTLFSDDAKGCYLLLIQDSHHTFQSTLRGAVDRLAFDSLQIASASATFQGSHFTAYLYLSEDEEGRQELEVAIRRGLEEWFKEKKGRKLLKLNIPRAQPSLDPRIDVDRRSGILIKMLYEGLMRLEGEGASLAIARDVKVSEDQKTYTFMLRPSQWSNGTPVTSFDFEYAWKKVLSPNFSSRYAYLFYPIKGAQEAKEGLKSIDDVAIWAKSPEMLVVELVYPFPNFLELLTHWTYSPLHQHLDALTPDWAQGKGYICNGPFKLTNSVTDRVLTLSKNPYYWASDLVEIEELRVSSIDDPKTNLALFEQEELDWVGDPLFEVPTSTFYQVLGEERVHSHPFCAVYWLELNVECFPFDSQTMRRAFAIALNRKEILRSVGATEEQPATSLFPPTLLVEGTPHPLRNDPTYAKKIFSQALQETRISLNRFPPIHFCYPILAGQQEIAEAIANQWREVLGIEVNVQGYPWAGYVEKMQGEDFHVSADTLTSWYRDPLYNLKPFSSRNHSLNTTRWEHPEYARLISEAERTGDLKKRSKLITTAERFILDEAVVIPIFYPRYHYAVRPRVEGVFFSDIGQIDFSRTRIKSGDAL